MRVYLVGIPWRVGRKVEVGIGCRIIEVSMRGKEVEVGIRCRIIKVSVRGKRRMMPANTRDFVCIAGLNCVKRYVRK